MINRSLFEISDPLVERHINKTCKKVIIDSFSKDEVIYMSGPITGIDNYKDQFKALKDKIEYIYKDDNVYIIDPTELIVFPEKINYTYIDMIIFSIRLIKIADIVIINDSDKNAWLNSRGCMVEASYAYNNYKKIYNYEYIEEALNTKKMLELKISEYNKKKKKRKIEGDL